jgi:predicted LPLAT superfamily acyltransferase
VTASIWLYLTPVYILVGLLLILGIFALLGRIAGGKYLRPIVTTLMKLPFLGRGMKKASEAALERQNPDLASAIKKLERYGATKDPSRAQAAMSNLTAAERRAYLDAAGEQVESMPQNRQMRRQMERARKRGRR